MTEYWEKLGSKILSLLLLTRFEGIMEYKNQGVHVQQRRRIQDGNIKIGSNINIEESRKTIWTGE